MFKIALNAGHYLDEPGRRMSACFDKDETKEWVLNARICEKVTEKMKDYSDYELYRVDDSTGRKFIKLADRARNVNRFGADIYVSVHHNAGINGGNGGGIVAYTYPAVDDSTRRLQALLYQKLIEKTGLSGNRANPLATADYAECRLTDMPAVLLECGFMDSATDAPVILTDIFAGQAAEAICEAIALYAGLEKVKISPPVAQKEDNLYRVQVGAYHDKNNAELMVRELKEYGFPAFIRTI